MGLFLGRPGAAAPSAPALIRPCLKVNNDVKFLNMFASICELLIQAKQRTMALKFDLHSSNATEFVSLNLFTRRLASIAAIICALNLKK